MRAPAGRDRPGRRRGRTRRATSRSSGRSASHGCVGDAQSRRARVAQPDHETEPVRRKVRRQEDDVHSEGRERSATSNACRSGSGLRWQQQQVRLHGPSMGDQQRQRPGRLKLEPVRQRAPAEIDHHRVAGREQCRPSSSSCCAIAHRRRVLDHERHTSPEQRPSALQHVELVALHVDPGQAQIVERRRARRQPLVERRGTLTRTVSRSSDAVTDDSVVAGVERAQLAASARPAPRTARRCGQLTRAPSALRSMFRSRRSNEPGSGS